MALDNLRGGTKRVVEENTPLNNLRGGTKRVVIVDGGGDKHNLGYYATQAALEEAHPTAEAGDWAIVGATDTVWIWDTDNSEWVDSDTKGQVTSVNGQTGDVVLDLLPTQTGNAGKFLTTDGTDASWSDKPLVNTATGGNSLSVLGTATNYSSSTNIGSTAQVSGTNATAIGHNATAKNNSASLGSLAHIGAYSVGAGDNIGDQGNNNVLIGYHCGSNNNKTYGVAIGSGTGIGGNGSIQIGHNSSAGAPLYTYNSDANTFKVGNANGNFEMMSADGTIPTDRLASTTGLADGNYRLRLVMSNGTPTLSWVAE